MTVLGIDEILKRVKKDNLVENLGERELNNPEGVGVDLRLGAIFEIIEGGAFIEVDGKAGLGLRKGVKTKEIARFDPKKEKQPEIILKKGDYYLVQSYEAVNTPDDLMPVLYPRGSLFRAGLLLIVSKTDPRYRGTLIMALINLSPFEVKLQMGARICNLVFYKVKGGVAKYRGQHQGGRVTPEKAERQV